MESQLSKIFKLSKTESGSFKYCGCKIVTLEDGRIQLDQNEYTEKLSEIEISDQVDNKRDLSLLEQRQLRGKIGKILWLSLMSRPYPHLT